MYSNLLKCAEKKWIVQKCSGVYRKVLEWNVQKFSGMYRKVMNVKINYRNVQECTELY